VTTRFKATGTTRWHHTYALSVTTAPQVPIRRLPRDSLAKYCRKAPRNLISRHHWEPQDDMPNRTDNAGLSDRAPPLGQLPLDLSPPRHRRESALSRAAPVAQPEAAPARYFTRREAAAYVRCSVRFLDGMGLPFIRKGRCKLYDRTDLLAVVQARFTGSNGAGWISLERSHGSIMAPRSRVRAAVFRSMRTPWRRSNQCGVSTGAGVSPSPVSVSTRARQRGLRRSSVQASRTSASTT